MSEDKTYPTLHLYAQDCWHEEAYIVGTREALIELQDAITVALAMSGEDPVSVAKLITTANDGEGYELTVAIVPDDTMREMQLPYTHPDFSFKGKSPFSL